MKDRILKIGVMLFLVAVLVAAGVYPVTSSQAAAKGTTYNVEVLKPSPGVNLISINGGTAAPQPGEAAGIKFQMVVGTKLKTEKVKTTGQTASYYEVVIPKKSFSGPVTRQPMIGMEGFAKFIQVMKKDTKGKLYVSGGDVDISNVLGKKLTTKIGDGTVDPEGSLIIDTLTVEVIVTQESTGKMFMKLPTTYLFTTGKNYIVAKGTKSKLEGKALPNDDNGKNVPTPLVGKPLDLDAGTGTLVYTTGAVNVKNKVIGVLDTLGTGVYNLKITK